MERQSLPSDVNFGQPPNSQLDDFDGANASMASESVDDLATVCGDSGASTPTIPAGKWGSRPATPVPS